MIIYNVGRSAPGSSHHFYSFSRYDLILFDAHLPCGCILTEGSTRHTKPEKNILFFVYHLRSQSMCGFKACDAAVLSHGALFLQRWKITLNLSFYLEQQRTVLDPKRANNCPTKLKTLNQIWLLFKFHGRQIVLVFKPTSFCLQHLDKLWEPKGCKCSSCWFHYMVCFFQGPDLLQCPLLWGSWMTPELMTSIQVWGSWKC